MTKDSIIAQLAKDYVVPYSTIENFIFDIEGLSANKKLLLLQLRRYAGANSTQAYPSMTTLMKKIGVSSKHTVIKNLRFFEWIYFIEIVKRYDGKGYHTSNLYIINPSNIEKVLKHFDKIGVQLNQIEAVFEEYYKEYKNELKTNNEVKIKSCPYIS